MEKKKFHFPPISGRVDLPANIYIDTLLYSEIEKRKKLGYKLIIPVADYVYEEYLSVGVKGFFLSRLMEYVSELSNIVLHYPIWYNGEHDMLSKRLSALDSFGFNTILLREDSSLSLPLSFNLLTIEKIFDSLFQESYNKYRILFYLALVPEATYIEKIKGVKDKKINFSLYNEALSLLPKFIDYIVGLLR